jgi:hypothetical protein
MLVDLEDGHLESSAAAALDDSARNAGCVMSVAMSTGIWSTWATIAVREEDRAHRARYELVRTYPAGDWGDATTAELEASLVAISGAAFAIDGFYGSVKSWCPISEEQFAEWKRKKLRRSSQIIEVLKSCFALGSGTNRWPSELDWLFKLRDNNVHSDEEFRPPASHPVLGLATHERMTYSVENAEMAVTLMLEMLLHLVHHPRPAADPQLVEFTRRWKPNIEAVSGLRGELKQLC